MIFTCDHISPSTGLPEVADDRLPAAIHELEATGAE